MKEELLENYDVIFYKMYGDWESYFSWSQGTRVWGNGSSLQKEFSEQVSEIHLSYLKRILEEVCQEFSKEVSVEIRDKYVGKKDYDFLVEDVALSKKQIVKLTKSSDQEIEELFELKKTNKKLRDKLRSLASFSKVLTNVLETKEIKNILLETKLQENDLDGVVEYSLVDYLFCGWKDESYSQIAYRVKRVLEEGS